MNDSDRIIVARIEAARRRGYTQEVTGTTGKSYTVRYVNNRWSCSCKAFEFHPDKECKHIRRVKECRNQRTQD